MVIKNNDPRSKRLKNISVEYSNKDLASFPSCQTDCLADNANNSKSLSPFLIHLIKRLNSENVRFFLSEDSIETRYALAVRKKFNSNQRL